MIIFRSSSFFGSFTLLVSSIVLQFWLTLTNKFSGGDRHLFWHFFLIAKLMTTFTSPVTAINGKDILSASTIYGIFRTSEIILRA